MNLPDTSKAVALSGKVFQRLLAAYPQAHREAYGAAMAQLFRDQCRDAWGESRGWGLTKLWLRVLPDVVGTSFLEHLESIKERKFMLNQISSLFRSAQTYKFFTVFTAVFLLVVISATVVTFILPESFGSTARIVVRYVVYPSNISNKNAQLGIESFDPYSIQTMFEVIKSEVVLDQVIKKLDLNTEWGRKYSGGDKLQTSETLDLLRRVVELRPIRNTGIIEIRAYSDKPDEAARIANAVAESFADYFNHLSATQATTLGSAGGAVAIIEKAMPGLKPFRPNKPLNITIGIVLGTLLGLLAGGSVAGIFYWRRQNSPPKIAT